LITENDEKNAFERRVRTAKEFVGALQRAYLNLFKGQGEMSKAVMDDLKVFCRADTTTFHTDPRKHLVLTGRHEVYLRIKAHTDLKTEDLYRYLGGKE